MNRRDFLQFGALLAAGDPDKPRPIIVSINVMLDLGAHYGRGLSQTEIAKFKRLQEQARKEFAVSAIRFELQFTEGAFVRTQGYSEIPSKFLKPRTINLFVTDSLGYDVDRDRTGGASTGPRPHKGKDPGDRFFKTYLGLQEARDTTLPHEYAHHFSLDTLRNPTAAKNLWADLRNDFWLWRQRHGSSIADFRACGGSEWARFAS